jgi:hypothetical protein
MQLNWFDLSKVANGTRVVFTEAWDIFPECIVPAGTTATVSENGLNGVSNRNTVATVEDLGLTLNELACACIVTPDDAALRAVLAEWDGDIWLTPPLDRSTGNREPDWLGLSPLSVTDNVAEKPSPDQTASVREVFMNLISGNPRFIEAKKSGKAFVIGGQRPRKSQREKP